MDTALTRPRFPSCPCTGKSLGIRRSSVKADEVVEQAVYTLRVLEPYSSWQVLP